MNPKRRLQAAGLVVILALNVSAFYCNSGTKNLAVASQAISHALTNAQLAVKQGVTDGVITAADEQDFEEYLVKAGNAGISLDQAIRANQSASSVSGQVNAFLTAFNQLNTKGVLGIKNQNLKLTVSTILTGAEASVAVIAAAVGGK